MASIITTTTWQWSSQFLSHAHPNYRDNDHHKYHDNDHHNSHDNDDYNFHVNDHWNSHDHVAHTSHNKDYHNIRDNAKMQLINCLPNAKATITNALCQELHCTFCRRFTSPLTMIITILMICIIQIIVTVIITPISKWSLQPTWQWPLLLPCY